MWEGKKREKKNSQKNKTQGIHYIEACWGQLIHVHVHKAGGATRARVSEPYTYDPPVRNPWVMDSSYDTFRVRVMCLVRDKCRPALYYPSSDGCMHDQDNLHKNTLDDMHKYSLFFFSFGRGLENHARGWCKT